MLENSNGLVSAGFDKFVRVFDDKMGYQERVSLESSSGILCGEVMDDLVIVGGADGNMLVFSTDSEECLFGFGADSQGGVNCLGITPDRRKVVTGGESGIPLLLTFQKWIVFFLMQSMFEHENRLL